MISKGSNPVLSLVTKTTVNVDFPREEYYKPLLPKKEKPKINGEDMDSLLFLGNPYFLDYFVPLVTTHH